jgi:hypothetical protein
VLDFRIRAQRAGRGARPAGRGRAAWRAAGVSRAAHEVGGRGPVEPRHYGGGRADFLYPATRAGCGPTKRSKRAWRCCPASRKA